MPRFSLPPADVSWLDRAQSTDGHLPHMSKHAARRRRAIGRRLEWENATPAFTDQERAAKNLLCDRLLRLYMMSRALFCTCSHCANRATDFSRSPVGRPLRTKRAA